MSVPIARICPTCSECLFVESSLPDPVILCAACGAQFRPSGNWPMMRTSRRAIASFVLGIVSIGGLCLTAIPALFLGLWALHDIQQPRNAEILSGRRLAIAGASLGAFFSLAMFALPLLALLELQQELQVETLERSARTHAENGRWSDAADELRQILELEPDNEWHWLQAAPVYAYADEEEYHRLCDEMLSHFAEPEDPLVAGRTAKTCLLLPPPTQSRLDAAFRLAEQAATQDPNHGAILWLDVTHGLAQYRLGQFVEAVGSCKKCQAGDPSDSTWARAALAYFVESLAHFQLGEDEDARKALNLGRSILNKHPDLEASWHDQLIARLLLDEAESASLELSSRNQ